MHNHCRRGAKSLCHFHKTDDARYHFHHKMGILNSLTESHVIGGSIPHTYMDMVIVFADGRTEDPIKNYPIKNTYLI